MLTDGASASNTGPGWQLAITTVAGAGSPVGPSNKKQRTVEQTNTDAAASQKPTGKGKGGKEKQRRPAMDDQVLASIARLTLQGAQQHRTWEASLLDTFLLPTSSQTATSMKQAGRAYHQEVQSASAGRRAELGPPHVHVYRAMVVLLVTQMQAMSPAPGPLSHSPAVGSWDHDGASLQNQARGGHKTPVPSPGRKPFGRPSEPDYASRERDTWWAPHHRTITSGFWHAISTELKTWKYEPAHLRPLVEHFCCEH